MHLTPKIILKKNRLFFILLIFLCLSFFLTGVFSVKNESITIDETAHIPSGYVALKYQNFNLNFEHPPLIKMIAAIPLLFENINYNISRENIPDQWGEGNTLLFGNNNDGDFILFSTRTSLLLFYTIIFFLLGLLLSQILSKPLSLIALFFVMFEPNILAHARYVTTDMGFAIFSLLSLTSLYLFIQQKKTKYAWMLAMSLGATLLSKFSGVFTYGFVVFALIIWFILFLKRKEKNKKMLFSLSVIALFPLMLTYIVYGIINFNTPVFQLKNVITTVSISKGEESFLQEMSNYSLTKPITSYMVGFHNAFARTNENRKNTFSQYLDGEFKQGEGWIQYFPLAYLYKETPVLIVLFFVSFFLFIYKTIKKRKAELFSSILLCFSLLYLLVAMFSSLNIGIRHISPVLITLPLFSIVVLDQEKVQSLKVYKVKSLIPVFMIAIILQVMSIVFTYPHFLAYFNVFAGGSEKGFEHLADSNMDWGNNLKRLSQWTKKNNINTMYVDYWGKSPLNYYNEDKDTFQEWHLDYGKPNGYFAVMPFWIPYSQYLKKEGRVQEDYSYLQKLTPIANIGYGVYVYDMREE